MKGHVKHCMLGRQLQIKTKRAPYKTNSIANIQSSDTPNASEDVEQHKFSYIVGGNAKWY